MKQELPPQTSGKAWAAALASLTVNAIVWGGGHLGLEFSAESMATLSVVVTPAAAWLGAYLKRNFVKEFS